MNIVAQALAIAVGLAVIGGITAVCLRSTGSAGVTAGRHEFRIHAAWFIVSAVGAIFLAGIFAVGYVVGEPELRTFCVGCAVASILGYGLFALLLRSFRVVVDDRDVTTVTALGSRGVAFSQVESVSVVGFTVEVRQKPDPATGKRGRSVVFLAGFKGLGDLLATIRTRAGLPPASPGGR